MRGGGSGSGGSLALVSATLVLVSGVGVLCAHGSVEGDYPDFVWSGRCHRGGPRCVVTEFGALGNGVRDDTAAIQRAIQACGQSVVERGGHQRAAASVVLPAGHRFVSGALNLSSGVDLVIEAGATLLGSTAPSAYPVVPKLPGYPTCRDNGYPAEHGYARHQALLSGWHLSNVSVCGGGTIDGQGLVQDPTLGIASRARRWAGAAPALHPYASTRIYIGDVNVTAPRDEGIPNDDGIDPDSSSDVLVERCTVSVGDNSVAIKSGMDLAGRAFAHPSFNLVFRDSKFTSETFAVGSEMSGSVFNLTVDNCVFGGDGSDYAGIHLKSARGRGGAVHALRFTNLVFHSEASVKQPFPFSASLFYSGTPPPTNASATPHFYDVTLENVTVFPPVAATKPREQRATFSFIGLPESRMTNFRFTNVTVVPGPAGVYAQSSGWTCTDVTGFTFSSMTPPLATSSTCLHT
eukprot:m.335423 g.335423  ORF g.335423 m.335423 type:complete len:463 (-) comp27770_c0_seq4:1076-2464(-)